MSADPGADLELARRAALQAGAVTMRYFGTQLDVEHKSPGQPLTVADLAADAILEEMLLGANPEDGWLSEEAKDSGERLHRHRVWIVDPIDGTRSFIAHRPEFAISIGLVVDGSVVLGVVYNPAVDELYHAVRGGGAFLERSGRAPERLRVSTRALGEEVSLLASRSEIAAGEFDPFHGGWRIQPVGSTAYKLARIAAGQGELFLSRGPKSEWDVCGGALLVHEAGGRVTDLDGEELRFNRADPYVHGVLATNGLIHESLLLRIPELPAPQRLQQRQRESPPAHSHREER